MNLQQMLAAFLGWALYPLWLLAGAGDYLCHRQTDIEHTSGEKESWLHLLQYGCLLIAFAAAVLLRINVIVFGVIVVAVLGHSLLGFLDVSYTDGRRYISPIEQYVHSFMEVLPLMATALFGLLHWPEIRAGITSPLISLRPSLGVTQALLIGSFVVLPGVPILEELVRTRRHRFERDERFSGRRSSGGLGDHQVEHHDQGEERDNAERDPPAQEGPVTQR